MIFEVDFHPRRHGLSRGLGQYWKFPYSTGENGGGAFVLVYLVCIALSGDRYVTPVLVLVVFLNAVDIV